MVFGTLITRGLATAAVLVACRESTDPEDARDLRDRLGTTYRAWSRVPGFETRTLSRTAHGKLVDVFWNDPAKQSSSARPFEAMAPGAVMVKEAYAETGELLNIAVMEKRFDGWFWAEWSPDGSVLFSGRPGLCVDCHRRGDDFLRTITPSSLP